MATFYESKVENFFFGRTFVRKHIATENLIFQLILERALQATQDCRAGF
jgi:hypothetical protein